ncbi:MAG: hypothetical protein J0L85_07955, partial [Zoogloea sp.]|nr:hypothetical protein [Zoogloea sp.]
GTPIELAHRLVEEQSLGVAEACKALIARGVAGDGLYPRITQRYPDGVPPADLDDLVAELLGKAAAPLRAVVGG